MWPPLTWLLSRSLDRRDRRAAVIIEIAVTVATVVVVGSAGIAEISESVITAIAVTAVTVDIFARAGGGRHERAARTKRAAAVSVRPRRNMTNQAMVAQAKEARRELLQTARGRNNLNHSDN